MTDYLGPLALGTSASGGTYVLKDWTAENGSAELDVNVQAASEAALGVAIDVLAAQLYQGNTYAHCHPGGTLPMVYHVAGVSGFRLLTPQTWAGHQQRVAFTLALTPRPAGALVTLYNAQHVDSPASLSLATLLGTNPPALDITIDDDSGNDMHSVIAALAPAALTDTMWLIKASSLTWTTMTSATNSSAWVDSAVRTTTSDEWQTTDIDTARYPQGKYRLAVRVSQSAGYGFVKDDYNDVAASVSRASLNVQVIGDVDLPVRDTAPGTAAPLRISVASDGTHTFTIDVVLLIPLSWGNFWWHHSTVTGECDQIDVGPSGIYVDGLTDTTHLRGGVLVPRVLAAHVPDVVTTAAPADATWPDDWGRTDISAVTAVAPPTLVSPSVDSGFVSYSATGRLFLLAAHGENTLGVVSRLQYLTSTLASLVNGTVAFKMDAHGWAGNDGVRHDLFYLRNQADSAYTVSIYKQTDNKWYIAVSDGSALTLASAALAFSADTSHVLIGRWTQGGSGTLDLNHDGTTLTQVTQTKTLAPGAYFSPGGYYGSATLGPCDVGPFVLYPGRISDAHTTALYTLLSGGGTGRAVYNFFRDRNYLGAVVIPLESDAAEYLVV